MSYKEKKMYFEDSQFRELFIYITSQIKCFNEQPMFYQGIYYPKVNS